MCTWVNVRNGDHFDWTIRSGSTPSSQTGPTSDHNGDTRGMTNTHIQLHRYMNLAVVHYFEKCYICDHVARECERSWKIRMKGKR